MADRPILFNSQMVKAILREIEKPGEGKTQTRRVLSPQPVFCGIYDDIPSLPIKKSMAKFTEEERLPINAENIGWCLPFELGDRLWVRETWATAQAYDDLKPSELSGAEPILYDADSPLEAWSWRGRVRQSIFMPRWASRITLEVTAVRVERLQDISEKDAIAEGARLDDLMDRLRTLGQPLCFTEDEWNQATPVRWFQDLWDDINGQPRGKGKPDISWDANPWVSVTTFKPYLCNIDQMADQ